MAETAANVRIGTTGGVWVAPLATTAPISPTASYGVGWNELGFIDDNGITESPNQDTKEIIAWQGATIVRRQITKAETTFKFTVIETNTQTWKLYYPGSTFATASGVTTATVKQPVSNPQAFAFDVMDGAVHQRIIVPRGEISDRGDLVYKLDTPIGYQFTMTCYPDAAGTVMLKLSDDPALVFP